MLLIDSIYINNSGGLMLLKYLVDCLEKSNIKVFYLFDKRTEDIFSTIPANRRKFLPASVPERLKFYTVNYAKYSTVLCFGNLPPPIRIQAKVFVYFHQPLFLKIPNEFKLKTKLIYLAKQQVVNMTKHNADVWLLQSQLMKEQLSKKYRIDAKKVEILPFYPPMLTSENLQNKVERQKNKFLYVSNVAPHKNHERLIEAFCLAYDKIQQGELVLTIPESANAIIQLINQKKSQGYPINNIGFIDRNELATQYLSSQYLIFPSLAESFGLGLVEAIDLGCKVIGADLPYTYQVCEPSLTFDAFSIDSIKKAIITASSQDVPLSKKIINNDINTLLKILEN